MKKSVIIIGGGIAGLGAARELVRKGAKVLLLEAKRRFGGRIHTLQPDSFPIELGAEFIHGRNPALLSLIEKAGLSTHRLPALQHLFDGRRLKKVNFWKQIDELIERINPRAMDCSFQDFLARQELDERSLQLARGYAEGFDAAQVDRISSRAILKAQRSADQMEGEWQGRVNEGYSSVIEFLEQEVRAAGGRLLRGAQVKQVRWKPGSAEVVWQREGRTQIETANAALLTLPLGIWKAKTVHIHPALPDKQMVIRELEFGNVVKVIFVFRTRWWPQAGNGIVQSINELLPTWWSDPRGPILTGWTGGPKADKLGRFSQQRLEALGLEILGRIFSERPSNLHKRLLGMHTHRWDRDPDIRGAYSYIPVNGLDLPKALAAPVADTLFFAGEATVADFQMGTVFGAYESGLRAVREMRAGFK